MTAIEERVAMRAYQRFEARGSVHGFDKEDWAAATADLQGESAADRASRPPKRLAELRSLKHIEGYAVSASDGEVGTVVDFLLDDEAWTIRNLVVETGTFFHGHKVLVTPVSFREIDWNAQLFHLALTIAKVKACPSLSADLRLSRRLEREYYTHYGYPYYWMYPGTWGMGSDPSSLLDDDLGHATPEAPATHDEMHLRSVKQARRFQLQSNDGPMGHIEDFIVDDQTWKIRYLVVNTSDWWMGKRVLIPPQWASAVKWDDGSVHIDVTGEQITASPLWDSSAPINREYEERLYDYYGRPAYWSSDASKRRHQT